jgi:hypothetical protein
MEKLRRETEALREKKEAERIAALGGKAPMTNGSSGLRNEIPADGDGEEGEEEQGDDGEAS